MGLLTELDRVALACYCTAYGRWVQAERALECMAEEDPANGGLTITTTSGNVIQNPLVGIANKARADALRAAAAARAKLFDFSMTGWNVPQSGSQEPLCRKSESVGYIQL